MTEDELRAAGHQFLDTNFERIHLEPRCHEERCWCEDDQGSCDDCGEPSIAYVRADLHAAAIARAESAERQALEMREALSDIIAADDDFRESMDPETEKDLVTQACDRARALLSPQPREDVTNG